MLVAITMRLLRRPSATACPELKVAEVLLSSHSCRINLCQTSQIHGAVGLRYPQAVFRVHLGREDDGHDRVIFAVILR
jgi:hypothetical protein